jgi:hypothetical protein
VSAHIGCLATGLEALNSGTCSMVSVDEYFVVKNNRAQLMSFEMVLQVDARTGCTRQLLHSHETAGKVSDSTRQGTHASTF